MRFTRTWFPTLRDGFASDEIAEGKALLKAEYYRFKDAIEDLSGVKIDVQRLKKVSRSLITSARLFIGYPN